VTEKTERTQADRKGKIVAATQDREQGTKGNWNVDLILDLELPLSVFFGAASMPLRDVLKLGAGSVIELDQSVQDPVTVFVNHKPIARGDFVTVDGNYGVRILEVENPAERLRSLR